MTLAVLDASAVLAFDHDESGADKVEAHTGQAPDGSDRSTGGGEGASAERLDEPTLCDLLGELRLDVRSHDADAAYAAAALHAQTREFGRDLGDRSYLALAIQLGVPALKAVGGWKNVTAKT